MQFWFKALSEFNWTNNYHQPSRIKNRNCTYIFYTVNGEILVHSVKNDLSAIVCGFSQDIRDAITTGRGLYGRGTGTYLNAIKVVIRCRFHFLRDDVGGARLSSHRRRHGGCMIYFRLSPFRALRFPPSISSSRFERATCVRVRWMYFCDKHTNART